MRTILAAALTAATLAGVDACSASPVPATAPAGGGTSTLPSSPAPASSAAAAGFVTTAGRSFEVDGAPFRFVGANVYDAAASDRYSCRAGSRMSDEQLIATFRYLHDEAGATVVRFWAYQTYTQGATYWDGVDRVLAAARQTGLRVIPVLEDGPGNCTTTADPVAKDDYRGDTWFSQGYRVPYGNATLSYRDYVARVAAHYADDPVILGWMMMNEAETNERDAAGRSQLVDFAADVAGVIHAADPNHLVTLGTQSNGAPGASGPDFRAVYSLPSIDFAEVHDWASWGSDTAPMPGGSGGTPPSASSLACAVANAPIGCSFAAAETLDKPLVVGEAGMQGTTAAERDRRARLLRAKMDSAFDAGAAGYLIWSVTTGNTDGYDVLTTTNDPLIAQLHAVAEEIR
ncbi:cellulase family glycosylhydrolase [Amnibacterium kyonggiense]|uniref:mannan endo-1,4-beta-mannosidase n=1 Tax=Amnibacterium kyonggiense TaxID=595671 RepID=A0A4R7FGV4_9MICO|nr:cellulase family glycosylhydrolase [Amnibacterium kyonggiense]TDS74830.1 aryl-phospho-beta-D-glucosidase BglC (GH1 family) [Amnibacterium kyonggiense]